MSIHRKILKTGVSWQVQWRDHTGKQHAKRFLTRKDAEAFQSQINLNKYQGLLPSREGTTVTFDEFARRWQELKETSSNGLEEPRPRTKKRQSEILRIHLVPIFGNRTLASITTGQINDAINRWQKIGLKPRTIRNHIYVLRPILQLAVDEQLITRNPVDGINLPKPGEVQRHVLSEVEVKRLIDELPEEHRALVITGLMTGTRFDEIANLRIQDLDLKKKTLDVTKSKTRAGIRVIPLSESEIRFLRHHVEVSRSGAQPNEPLFVSSSKHQKKLNHSNFMKRVFKPAAARAGIPSVKPHDLRRTHATFLAESGLPQTTLHVHMGHESLSTTQKYYVIPTQRGQEQAAGIVSEILNLPMSNEGEQP